MINLIDSSIEQEINASKVQQFSSSDSNRYFVYKIPVSNFPLVNKDDHEIYQLNFYPTSENAVAILESMPTAQSMLNSGQMSGTNKYSWFVAGDGGNGIDLEENWDGNYVPIMNYTILSTHPGYFTISDTGKGSHEFLSTMMSITSPVGVKDQTDNQNNIEIYSQNHSLDYTFGNNGKVIQYVAPDFSDRFFDRWNTKTIIVVGDGLTNTKAINYGYALAKLHVPQYSAIKRDNVSYNYDQVVII